MSSFCNLFHIKRVNSEEHSSNSSVQDRKSIAFKIVVTCNTRKAVYIPHLLGKSLLKWKKVVCPSIHIQKHMMLCLVVQRTFHVANMLPLLRNTGLCIEVQAKGRSKIEPLRGACDLCILSFCEIHLFIFVLFLIPRIYIFSPSAMAFWLPPSFFRGFDHQFMSACKD